MIKFIRTEPHDLPFPSKGSELAAGYDLCSAIDITIYPGQRYAVPTGWRWDCTEHHGIYGRIAPRSGVAFRNGIAVMAGVVDPDYMGEIKAILHNTDERPFVINRGDRIAQLVPELHAANTAETCEGVVEEMAHTERGQSGFGSTGK